MVTKQEVITTAEHTLSGYPFLSSRVSSPAIARSVEVSWPEPPAPLVFLLFIAGGEYTGTTLAKQMLDSLELILALLTKTAGVSGAWQSRMNRVIPPRRGSNFQNSYSNFQSALFELNLAYRLYLDGISVLLNGENDVAVCDISLLLRGDPLVSVEAYAPRKGMELWHERTIARPWRQLVAGETATAIMSDQSARRISIDPNAVASAMSDALTTSNFDQKVVQLGTGVMPTLLAVRGYWLTKTLEQLASLTPPLDIARRMDPAAWSRLPSRCAGILLSLLGDVLKVQGRASPVVFIPAPNRTVSRELWEYLDGADMLSADVRSQRGRLVDQ